MATCESRARRASAGRRLTGVNVAQNLRYCSSTAACASGVADGVGLDVSDGAAWGPGLSASALQAVTDAPRASAARPGAIQERARNTLCGPTRGGVSGCETCPAITPPAVDRNESKRSLLPYIRFVSTALPTGVIALVADPRRRLPHRFPTLPTEERHRAPRQASERGCGQDGPWGRSADRFRPGCDTTAGQARFVGAVPGARLRNITSRGTWGSVGGGHLDRRPHDKFLGSQPQPGRTRSRRHPRVRRPGARWQPAAGEGARRRCRRALPGWGCGDECRPCLGSRTARRRTVETAAPGRTAVP